jgi:tetratricopeptide (TPR) repeat protein
MMLRMAIRTAALVLALALPATRAAAQGGQGPEPVFQETNPYEKPERKAPSMWWWRTPSADTAAQQLALAARSEKEGHTRRAIAANLALVRAWHSAPEAVTAQQNLARLLEESAEYEDAFLEYQYLVAYFAGQFPYLELLDRQYRCANAFTGEDHRFLGLHLSSQRDARLMYERILLNGPNWTNAPEVALRIGTLHEVDDETEEAIAAYERVANRYPTTEAAREAAYRGAACRSQLALTHPRDAKARDDAVAAMLAFRRKYPRDPRTETLHDSLKLLETQSLDAAWAQAVFYDRSRHNRASAITAYREFQRRFPDAPQAKEAAARLQLLERNPFPVRQGVTNEVVR